MIPFKPFRNLAGKPLPGFNRTADIKVPDNYDNYSGLDGTGHGLYYQSVYVEPG